MATWVTIYEDTEKRIERYDVGTPNAEGMTVYPERTIYRNPNYQTIRDQAAAALAANRTFVALASPTAAQNTAQAKALTRQMNGVIRILLNALDGTD